MSEKKQTNNNQQDEVFDYTQCECELRLYKQTFLGKDHRYAYLTNNSLIICKEPYQKIPDKIIPLTSDMRIKWLYDPKKETLPFPKRVIGFRVFNPKNPNDLSYQYLGQPVVIVTLREYIGRIIFQSDFLKEYDIKLKLGQGKYAQVYEVINKQTQSKFAVQYLHQAQLATIEDGIDSLHNELQILRKLSHKNIIKFITAYEDDNGFYILTDLLNGQKTLQHEITQHQNGGMKFSTIRQIMKQLLEAMQYCHSLGLMHRDLQPQNIMFANNTKDDKGNQIEGELKVIDFGLSQIVKQDRYIYVHVGTPGYVAPEILANESENHRYTEKCDIFSVGVIFHILQAKNYELQKIALKIKPKNLSILNSQKHESFQTIQIFSKRMTGKAVFPGKQFSQVFKANKLCQISLVGPKYDDLDPISVDLMNQLLEPNPVQRVTATQALKHQFFTDNYILPQRKQSNSNHEESSSPLIKYRKGSMDMMSLGEQQLTKARVISLRDMDKYISRVIQGVKDFKPLIELSKQKQKEDKNKFCNFAYKLVNLFWKIEEGFNVSQLSASPVKRKYSKGRNPSPFGGSDGGGSPSNSSKRNNTIRYTLSPSRKSLELNNSSVMPEQKSITLTPIKNDEDDNYFGEEQKESELQNGSPSKSSQGIDTTQNISNQNRQSTNEIQYSHIQKPQPIITTKDQQKGEKPESPFTIVSSVSQSQPELSEYSPGLQNNFSMVEDGIEESKINNSAQNNEPKALFRVDLFQQANTVPLELDGLRPYFPDELFASFDETDDDVVQTKRCRVIAVFLIFGKMDNQQFEENCQLADMKILLFEKDDTTYFDSFILDMLKSMLDPNPRKVPNFVHFQSVFESQIPSTMLD